MRKFNLNSNYYASHLLGHIEGPYAPVSIKRKLHEMDETIRKLYTNLKSNDLLVVLSDHGMANEGGHGGSSSMEISTPVVFISKLEANKPFLDDLELLSLFKNIKTRQQTDLVSTLSCLFNLPIPLNNRGIMFMNDIIDYIGKYYNKEENLSLNVKIFNCLNQNFKQLNQLLDLNDKEIETDLKSLKELFVKYLSKKNQNEYLNDLNLKFEKLIRERLEKEKDSNSINRKQAYYLTMAIVFMLLVRFTKKNTFQNSLSSF